MLLFSGFFRTLNSGTSDYRLILLKCFNDGILSKMYVCIVQCTVLKVKYTEWTQTEILNAFIRRRSSKKDRNTDNIH